MVDVFGLPLSMLLLLAGAGLVVLEALAPGAHFIVVGVALLVAGLVGILLGSALGPLTPLVLAAVVLAAGAGTLYAYRNLDFYSQDAGRTSDSDALRGKTGRVTERVTGDGGEVKLEDGGFNPYYRARSLDGAIEVGEEVLVVDPGGGNVVTVESMAAIENDSIDRELARERRRREADDDRGEPAADGDGDAEPEAETDAERDGDRDPERDGEPEAA
jgi:membrane protein implicated in regulation of membrane protease activity